MIDLNYPLITVNGTDEIEVDSFTSGEDLQTYLNENYPNGYEITDFDNIPDFLITAEEVDSSFWDLLNHNHKNIIMEMNDVMEFVDVDEMIAHFDNNFVGDDKDSFIKEYCEEYKNVPYQFVKFIDQRKLWDTYLSYYYFETKSGYIFSEA